MKKILMVVMVMVFSMAALATQGGDFSAQSHPVHRGEAKGRDIGPPDDGHGRGPKHGHGPKEGPPKGDTPSPSPAAPSAPARGPNTEGQHDPCARWIVPAYCKTTQ